MRTARNSSSFTLLELIIVIIIVGVLASLALPRFFKAVEVSRSVEAISNLRSIRLAVERCRLMNPNGGSCACTASAPPSHPPWDILAIEDPATAPNAHFTYSTSSCGGANYTYGICAYRNSLEMATASGYICMAYDDVAGVAITGFGIYDSIQP